MLTTASMSLSTVEDSVDAESLGFADASFDAVFDGQPVLLVRSWAEVCVGNATNASLLDGALRRFHSVGAQLDPRRWLGWCERRRSR